MKIDDKNLKKIKISPITSIIPEEEIEKAERLSQKTSYGGSLSKRLKDSFIVYASAQINGENVLDDSIFALTMHQKAASHCSFEMLCSADDFEGRKDYPLKNSRKLLGSRITFHLWQFSKITSSFTGVISQIRSQRTDGYSEVVISGYSPTILLEDGKECRSWEDRTLAEIVTEVTKEYPQDTVQTTINPNLKDRLPYTVQYRESDWDFLKRLAARYGEWLYYDGQYIAFGGGYSKTLELIEKEDIYDYNLDMKLVPQKFDYSAYDAKLGKVHEADSERVDIARRVINPFQIDALEASEKAYPKKPSSLYNRNLLEGGLGELTSVVRRQKQSRRNVMYMYAKTNNPNIRLGDCVRMYGWVAGNTMFSTPKVPIETYMVTEIIHHMNIAKDGYWNEIWGVPEDVEVPDYFDEDAVPQCEEQSAVVTDNNDPRGMGRVRVQFAWQKNSNRKSPWIRLVQPHGGAGKGFHFLPEIGEEVMVSFEGGNAEKPFVLGAHYNGKEKSGYTTENNDLKVIETRSGIKIIINDAEGSLYIEDAGGSTYKMDGNGDIDVKAPKDIKINVGENMNINAGSNLILNSGNQTTMNTGEQMHVTTPYLQQLISNYYHTQAGKVLINSQDEIKIEAKQTSVAGTERLLMHSDQTALLNSQGMAEVKGEQGTSLRDDPVEYKAEKIPNGGKYYEEDGHYLGEDNLGDDKCFVATKENYNKAKNYEDAKKANTSKETNTSSKETDTSKATEDYSYEDLRKDPATKDLTISHTDFQEAVSIIEQEGDTDDPEEYRMLASIFYNKAKHVPKDLVPTLRKESSVYKGKTGNPKLRFKPTNDTLRVLASREGVIHQLLTAEDLTKGATQNDGEDFWAWGLHHGPYGKNGKRMAKNDGSHARFRDFREIFIPQDIFDKAKAALWSARKSGTIIFKKYGITKPIPIIEDVFLDLNNFDANCNFDYNTGQKGKSKLTATAFAGLTIYWKEEK